MMVQCHIKWLKSLNFIVLLGCRREQARFVIYLYIKNLYECLKILGTCITAAVVAEWLRRWTWNPMGSARVGSNPANCEIEFCLHWWYELSIPNLEHDYLLLFSLQYFFRTNSQNIYVRCGVRTHAIFRLWVLKTHALDHSANLTVKQRGGFRGHANTE